MKNSLFLLRIIFILSCLVIETSGLLFGLFERLKQLEEDVKELQEGSLIVSKLNIRRVETNFSVAGSAVGTGVSGFASCGATAPTEELLTGGGFKCAAGTGVTPPVAWRVVKNGPDDQRRQSWEVTVRNQTPLSSLDCVVYALCGRLEE